MLTLWYGGTFDPVHHGHLAIARAAAQAFAAPVTLVPAADPPHRAAPGADAGQRAHMLALAAAGDPALRVDLRELHRAGPSWTVDTLEALRAQLGAQAPVALLLGADSFRSLPGWKAWRRLPQLAHLVVAARLAADGSDDLADLPADLAAEFAPRWTGDRAALAGAPAGCAYRLAQPLRAESATAVRAAIAAGDPAWRTMVPAPVAAFIGQAGLYRAGPVVP